jgi:UDP-3-O-[3-hydroxymyristoyl] glucosamine N-acyltransferase
MLFEFPIPIPLILGRSSDDMFALTKILEEAGIDFSRLGPDTEDGFDKVLPPDVADPGSLIFFQSPTSETIRLLRTSRAAVAILPTEWAAEHIRDLADAAPSLFLVDHPRLAVVHVLRRISDGENPPRGLVHPTAVVDPDAQIHASVVIGPYCVIGRCIIDEGSRIGAHTIVKDEVRIGKAVDIREFCLIGGDGFGMVRREDSTLIRMPHMGRTVIEDDVEIFPYTNVDRGTLVETRVRRGAKLDHYVHIGHNAVVGEDAVVTAGAVFCGHSTIGARSWLGVGSILKESVVVGSDVLVGLGTVVLKDVPDGSIVAGVPGRLLRDGPG